MSEEATLQAATSTNGNGSAPPTGQKRPRSAIKRRLTAEDWSQIDAMAGAGIPMPKIALAMGLSERTLYRWRKLRPELEAALEKGLSVTEGRIGLKLVEKALAGDLGAIVFWERTRIGRRDSREVTSGGPPLTSIVYTIQSAAGELLDAVEPKPPQPLPDPKPLGVG